MGTGKTILSRIILQLLFTMAACLVPSSMRAGVEPEGLEFAHTQFSFGSTPRDTVLTHAFPFTNLSGEPVVIIDISTTCPCVSVQVPAEPVAPGQAGEIVVTYHAPKSMPGRYQQLVRVWTGNTDKPVKLYIFGELTK